MNDWHTKELKGRAGGVKWTQTIKERLLKVSKITRCRLVEGIILSNKTYDRDGNVSSFNTLAGYHYISILYGSSDQQLYFAFKHKDGWRVLSDDARTYVKDYKTKSGALKDLLRKL